ncbi:MAG: peroxiredoxin family protein [Spirochaetia bacterium]
MSQRVEPTGVKQNGRSRTLRIAIIGTVALAVVIAGVGIAISVANGSSQAVAASQAQAAAQAVPAEGAIDFQPTREIDTGKVEGLPANAVHDGDNPSLLAVGSTAPDFNLESAAGQKVRLSDFRGKTVLLEFYATWCPHCQAEAPHLKSLMATLPASSFTMLQVVADSEDAASLLAFDTYYGMVTPALMDPGSTPGSYYHQGSTGPVTLQYRIAVFPTFYVINPKGRISWRADHEQPDALVLEKLKDAAGS